MLIPSEFLSKYKRIAIAGGPRSGKTLLASRVSDRPVFHTDDFMHLDWKVQPAFIIELLEKHDRFVIEGVQVARSLRKGLVVDAVIYLQNPKVDLTTRQEGMRKTIDKVFREWYDMNSSVVPVTFLE